MEICRIQRICLVAKMFNVQEVYSLLSQQAWSVYYPLHPSSCTSQCTKLHSTVWTLDAHQWASVHQSFDVLVAQMLWSMSVFHPAGHTVVRTVMDILAIVLTISFATGLCTLNLLSCPASIPLKPIWVPSWVPSIYVRIYLIGSSSLLPFCLAGFSWLTVWFSLPNTIAANIHSVS